MTHYYIKNCYIKNRTAFIISVLGCINREVNNIDKDEDEKRRNFSMALDSLSRCLMTALRIENNPDEILGMHDSLEAALKGSFYSKVQEKADDVVKLLEDDITIHYTGPFGETTTEYEEWLPDFHDKIKIVFE